MLGHVNTNRAGGNRNRVKPEGIDLIGFFDKAFDPFAPGVTALDALGPYEVLKMIPGVDLRLVAHGAGPVTTDRDTLVVGATHSFDETPTPDLVLVPGSEVSTFDAASDVKLTVWLNAIHQHTTFTVSVCSGAVALGASGLLNGRPATIGRQWKR
ncbi:DJ-1/PfpI family protein [Aliiroseovarius lamellibrachiae]|uniref:DJ-1/PfpI family protein n=1 Tax=Aliiroseovarius lamellibrachiae TaxID=1924933 RepID=UPI001BE069E3|nr:DJ-1/PfpI family protein [Aliiroseovarius lamellibrachiae]MBT2130413.1 DJ-1/PfpI family protein [Aliiroseovarius lamellibrachiae]